MSLTLTTHDTGFDDPDAPTIAAVLASLDGSGRVLATLGRSHLTYLQASGSSRAGFVLEYQEDSLDQHYCSRAADVSLEHATAMFQQYARGDDSWRQGTAWEHVPFVPKKIPWFSTWVGYLAILALVIALIWYWRRP